MNVSNHPVSYVPFLDLKRQLPPLRAQIDEAFRRVLDRGSFILGEEGEAFEEEFASYHGARHAIGVGNGTDAIALALRACGKIVPGQGHEVITTPLTAGFTALGILMAGGVPVFADLSEDTLLMDPESAARQVGSKTRALLPVHLYGQLCDTAALRKIADAHGLFLLEDCSQSHGSRRAGRLAGTLGDAGTFSFYPTKNLGAYGDGGMVLSSDGELAERVRRLRKGGLGTDGAHQEAGINSRLDEIQAAALRVKLRRLNDWNRRRIELAERYRQGLAGTRARLCLPGGAEAGGCLTVEGHNFHLFVIRHAERDALRTRLERKGIQALIHYPKPLHQQQAFLAFARKNQVLPVAERACREILSLPLYPELLEAEQNQVVAAIREYDGLGA